MANYAHPEALVTTDWAAQHFAVEYFAQPVTGQVHRPATDVY